MFDRATEGVSVMREIRPTEIEYDEDKFRELIIYVASRMGEDWSFGATLLNKVLFFSDFWYYAEHGRPIAGADYQKLQNGPAPRRLLPIQNELIQNGEAHIVTKSLGPYVQKRLVPLRGPDLSYFTGSEISFVDDVIGIFRDKSATRVSEQTHKLAAWKMARIGQTLPYNGIFIYDGPVTDDDVEHAREIAAQLSEELRAAGAV